MLAWWQLLRYLRFLSKNPCEGYVSPTGYGFSVLFHPQSNLHRKIFLFQCQIRIIIRISTINDLSPGIPYSYRIARESRLLLRSVLKSSAVRFMVVEQGIGGVHNPISFLANFQAQINIVIRDCEFFLKSPNFHKDFLSHHKTCSSDCTVISNHMGAEEMTG